MTDADHTREDATILMDAAAMAEAVRRIAEGIVAANPHIESLVMLGILSRGRPLADRLAARIGTLTGTTPPVGSLATTLYRDDFRSGAVPRRIRTRETHFGFDIDGKTVVLVDDVLAAGRTIRAAMDETMDYGRPARIQLACLVDRGGRELPIQPDYLGAPVSAAPGEYVSVRLKETDDEDIVLLEEHWPEAGDGGD